MQVVYWKLQWLRDDALGSFIEEVRINFAEKAYRQITTKGTSVFPADSIVTNSNMYSLRKIPDSKSEHRQCYERESSPLRWCTYT